MSFLIENLLLKLVLGMIETIMVVLRVENIYRSYPKSDIHFAAVKNTAANIAGEKLVTTLRI